MQIGDLVRYHSGEIGIVVETLGDDCFASARIKFISGNFCSGTHVITCTSLEVLCE
jgi:hypothetical protein